MVGMLYESPRLIGLGICKQTKHKLFFSDLESHAKLPLPSQVASSIFFT
jgi:hypothetical protein